MDEPITRREQYYAGIAEALRNGGGGGGGGSSKLVAVVDRSVTEITASDLEGVTEIGDYAFYRCVNLGSVTLPNNITSIGSYAFSQCLIESIELPSSVTFINVSAFRGCSNLTSVTIKAIYPPDLANKNAFNNTSENLVIYVPAESVSAYQTANVWTGIADKIQAIPA